MAFGDPSSPFFAFDASGGERPVCLLDEVMTDGVRGFCVLSRDLDAPDRGSWDPRGGTLTLGELTVAVDAAGVAVARAVCVDTDERTVTLADDMTCPVGCTTLYPGYFDSVPAGKRIEDLLYTASLPDPEDMDMDDEIDWADHHVAEMQALARAESLI
jgi:hypothetical protein